MGVISGGSPTAADSSRAAAKLAAVQQALAATNPTLGLGQDLPLEGQDFVGDGLLMD